MLQQGKLDFATPRCYPVRTVAIGPAPPRIRSPGAWGKPVENRQDITVPQTAASKRSFSFEYFPPRTEAAIANLREVHPKLAALHPAYFSVTFGAGGSTQSGTFETVADLKRRGSNVAPHLSCIGTTRPQIREILQAYRDLGISRLVALRGDLPSGSVDPGDFRYANELVAFVRQEFGDHFYIEVAAYPETHPQAESPTVDIDNFVRKVKAGANAAITQYFYNADAYFRFLDELSRRQVDIPVVPGIMPITNYTQLARFSDACGAEIPQWIRKRLQAYGEDLESIRKFGLDVVIALCERLLAGGVPGLHIYTLNKWQAPSEIWNALRLNDR